MFLELERLLVTWGWPKERLLLGAFGGRAETRLAEDNALALKEIFIVALLLYQKSATNPKYCFRIFSGGLSPVVSV